MWSKDGKRKRNRLSREILGVTGAAVLIAVLCYGFLRVAGEMVIFTYIESHALIFTDYEIMNMELGLESISFLSAVILFVVLFLFLVGERIAYISEIIKGIEALGRHEWDYQIPLEGNNELTELAKRVNELSKEERVLREKEKQMQEERESLIRGLSHDIRTPLTSILSYSEYVQSKDGLNHEEVMAYAALMEQKAKQMKALTDCLLEGGNRTLERIETGKFLMQQLADEWATELEDGFDCRVDMAECSSFSGEFDVQELRRIFDNLASNIRKYADSEESVHLCISVMDEAVCIRQSNIRKKDVSDVESTGIGIESIRKIATGYGGSVEVKLTEEWFEIEILLRVIMKSEI